MDKIEKQILKKVTPSPDYKRKLQKIIKEIETKLEKEVTARKLPATIEIVGSTAKDTYLKDNLDIDFFILFPTRVSKIEISKNALSIGRKILKNPEESYAEHPYIRGFYKDFFVEIVPCYKIEKVSQKMSAVDRTPLHTKFIKEKLPTQKKPDVLLFKQFLKGIGCYGAEAEIEGFSGYLCELIVLYYGSFSNILKNAQNWKKGEKLTLSKGKYPSFDTPLTFIDPVDPDRNVASALSKEQFNLFKRACKEYLQKPSITFFFPNKVKPWPLGKIKKELKALKYQFIGLKVDKPDIIDENLYPQVRKAARSIRETSDRNGFTIYDTAFHIDDKKNTIYIVIKAKEEKLSPTVQHMGPPTKLKKNSDEFLSKWKKDSRLVKKPYEKNGRLYVEIKREYVELKKFLKDQIKEFSMGKHIDQIVKKKYSILKKDELISNNLAGFWTEYLDGKMRWER